MRHNVNPYPTAIPPFLSTIVNSIKSTDNNFSLDNYSCMIEKYQNGYSTFPHHTDPDEFIDSTSNIYNVSIGATRRLEFLNQSGPINPVVFELSDGDVYSIPASSQGIWSRSMLADSSINEPVVLITFRKLRIPPPRAKPPPLGLPGHNINIKRDILMERHKDAGATATSRMLFLTDSMLSSIPSSSLSANKKDKCEKKTLYYLSEFSNYEAEFEYSQRVIISYGINDITRRYLSPEIISDIVLPQIKRFSRLYPNTEFIFNTVLLTTCEQTNNYVVSLNKYLARGIRDLPNVYSFDSHSILLKSRIRTVYVDRKGIHISRESVNHIKNELIQYLKYR